MNRMTDREKAIVMAHTGICMLTGDKFQIFHKYVEDIMGRPIMTHEMGWLGDAIKEKSKADFMALCADESSSENPSYNSVKTELDAISRQALKDLGAECIAKRDENGNLIPLGSIDSLPSASTEKTGHWRHYEGMLICSECGTEFYDDIMEYCGDDVPKCCPECGAKMEVEE